MSDLFHPQVPYDFIDEIMQVIRDTGQHVYQILTKHDRRMAAYFRNREVPANAWLGVSVENKRHGVPRIDTLRQIDADVRY